MSGVDLAPLACRTQHGAIERVDGRELIDTAGNVATPYRAVDTLAMMHKRGTIDGDMLAAGRAFQELFALACFQALRAADVSRVPGCGQAVERGARAAAAGRVVWADLARLGGVASPAGSCCWHVLGEGCGLGEWAVRHGRSREAAGGVLAAALGVLAGGLR